MINWVLPKVEILPKINRGHSRRGAKGLNKLCQRPTTKDEDQSEFDQEQSATVVSSQTSFCEDSICKGNTFDKTE